MKTATRSFLLRQKASADNPLGSHQTRSRAIAIKTAKADEGCAWDMADDIEANISAASEVSGFHPDSCRRLAAWLRDWRLAL